MQPQRHHNRVLRNTLSLFTGQTGAQILALVFAAYLSKNIPTDAYGSLSFALSFVVIFNVLSEYGLWTLLVRTMARDKAAAGDFFWNSIVLKAVLAVVATALGGLTLVLFYPSHDLQVLTCLAGGWLLFNAWYFSAAAVFRAFQEHHLDGTLSFIGKVLYVGLGLVVVHFTKDVRWIAGLFTMAMAVQCLLACWLVVKRHPEFLFAFSLARQAHLLRHAWLFFVISAFTTVNLKFALLAIGKYCTRSEIGYYSVAAMLVLVPIVLANAFVQSMYPVLAECHERGDDEFWDKVAVGMRWLAALAFPVIFFMSIDGGRIIETVFRKEFVAGLVPMQILLWGLGLDFFNPFSGHVLYVLNRQKTVIAITGASVLTTVVATLVLTRMYGIVGASVAMVLSLSVMFWGYALALRQWLPITRLLWQIGVPMIIAAVLTAVPWWLRAYVPFWVNGPVYCLLCAAAYFATRALRLRDMHIFGGHGETALRAGAAAMDRQRSAAGASGAALRRGGNDDNHNDLGSTQ